MKLAASEVRVGPSHIFRLADPHAAVGEKANKVRAILRLACAGGANLLNESQKLFA